MLVLRRSSNVFDWFDQFCGEDGDVDSLDTFLSTLRSKPSQMKRVTMISPLHDEDAPVSHVLNSKKLFLKCKTRL